MFYKIFKPLDNIILVVVPVYVEYKEIKSGAIHLIILGSNYSKTTKLNIIRMNDKTKTVIFGNSRIDEKLKYSKITAKKYID